MRRTLCVIAGLCYAASAEAAFVTYRPVTPDRVPWVPGFQIFPGDDVVVDIIVTTEIFDAIEGIDLILASDQIPLGNSPYNTWQYSPDAHAQFTTLNSPSVFGIYPYPELVVGGNTLLTPPPGTSLWLGTLTIDTSALALYGGSIFTDPDRDFTLSNVLLGANADPIRASSFSFVVIPEPATLALLLVAAAPLALRRRGTVR